MKVLLLLPITWCLLPAAVGLAQVPSYFRVEVPATWPPEYSTYETYCDLCALEPDFHPACAACEKYANASPTNAVAEFAFRCPEAELSCESCLTGGSCDGCQSDACSCEGSGCRVWTNPRSNGSDTDRLPFHPDPDGGQCGTCGLVLSTCDACRYNVRNGQLAIALGEARDGIDRVAVLITGASTEAYVLWSSDDPGAPANLDVELGPVSDGATVTLLYRRQVGGGSAWLTETIQRE